MWVNDRQKVSTVAKVCTRCYSLVIGTKTAKVLSPVRTVHQIRIMFCYAEKLLRVADPMVTVLPKEKRSIIKKASTELVRIRLTLKKMIQKTLEQMLKSLKLVPQQLILGKMSS